MKLEGEELEEQMEALEAIRDKKYQELKKRGLIPVGDENYETIQIKDE